MVSLSKTGVLSSLILMLAACGGGGGGGGAAPAAAGSAAQTFTLSGTITLPETAAVDSDTNDTGQPDRATNDTIPSAQVLTTPVQLVGTVNIAGKGAVGANYAAGDPNDYFATSLAQGQVIEMAFVGGATSGDDLDLYLIDNTPGSASLGLVVGYSTSSAKSKCIQISRTGTYYLRVQATTGSGLYTLRIGAPGEATCSVTSTSTDPILADELVAKMSAGGSSVTRGEIMRATGLQAVDGLPRERPHLLRLAQDDAQRANGLTRLAHWGRPGAARLSATHTEDFPARFRRAKRTMDTLEYAKRLMATGQYDYVEPNFRVELFSTYTSPDPQYVAQRWSYQQINQPSAMDRIAALSLPVGTQRPIVAVIDTGIVSDHPDLQTQIAGGYSFVTTTTGDGDVANGNDPSKATDSPVWHGTHVAGTIAALDSNGLFGAGAAPQALIMPLRVFSPSSNASSYDIVQAMRYASGLSNRSGTVPSRKADIINMSLGSSNACSAQFSTEIANARDQNVIVVVASGNHKKGLTADVSSPANCPGAIAVGAVDALKQPTYYSNTGATLALAAPGGDSTQSTTGTGYSDSIYSTIGSFNGAGVRAPSFGPLTGTSMATPHVAAVLALMRYVNPALTPTDIDTLIANGQISDDIGTAGRDDATGYGLINARKAVDAALSSSAGAVPGIVTASPASISFGSLGTNASLELKLTAASTETVISVVSNSAAVTVAASSIDATTKLGTYGVTVNRAGLPLGTSFPTLTVTTSTRSFAIQLTIIKLATGTSVVASYGRVALSINNASTSTRIGYANLTPANGKYAWSISGIPAGPIRIMAGTNLNYNGYFCDEGEVCGIFPSTADSVTVTGDMSGLDFAISPSTATSASGLFSIVPLRPASSAEKANNLR